MDGLFLYQPNVVGYWRCKTVWYIFTPCLTARSRDGCQVEIIPPNKRDNVSTTRRKEKKKETDPLRFRDPTVANSYFENYKETHKMIIIKMVLRRLVQVVRDSGRPWNQPQRRTGSTRRVSYSPILTLTTMPPNGSSHLIVKIRVKN